MRNYRKILTTWTRRPGGAGGAGAGFTLIELLVVIAILFLLMTIMVPGVVGVRVSVRKKASITIIRMLETGCRLYRNDFGEFPESSPAEFEFPAGVDWEGRNRLVQALTGFLDDDGDDADGADGFGFRVVSRGKVYGPYNGAEEIGIQTEPSGLPAFLDASGNRILYYRFDDVSGAYDGLDNADGPADINDYAKDASDDYYTQGFLIISPGADGQWPILDDEPSDFIGDDITNFMPE